MFKKSENKSHFVQAKGTRNLRFYCWQLLYSLKNILILISTLKWFWISVRPIIFLSRSQKVALGWSFSCDVSQCRGQTFIKFLLSSKKTLSGQDEHLIDCWLFIKWAPQKQGKNKRLHQSVKWDHWKSGVNDQTNNNREIQIVTNPPPVHKNFLRPTIQSFRDALTSP